MLTLKGVSCVCCCAGHSTNEGVTLRAAATCTMVTDTLEERDHEGEDAAVAVAIRVRVGWNEDEMEEKEMLLKMA